MLVAAMAAMTTTAVAAFGTKWRMIWAPFYLAGVLSTFRAIAVSRP
jgi:hypothetical protein